MREPAVLHVDNHVLVVAKPACLPTVADASGDASLQEWGKILNQKSGEKMTEICCHWYGPA